MHVLIDHSKRRNSSIELYRIIAALAVVVTHFNGWFVGGVPPYDGVNNLSTTQVGQVIIACATLICVNMFLLISGFFGLHFRAKTIAKLYLILLSVAIPFYLIKCLYYWVFSIKSFLGCFFVISRFGYFIQCYFMLIFLSPVINAFVEKYSKKTLLQFCLLFLFIEFWFGCIMNKESFGFSMGYSVIHFVLMYFIGRCIYSYKDYLISFRKRMWVAGYFTCTLFLCLLYVFNVGFWCAYSNPVVVLSSICSFIPFLYRGYYSYMINWVASATLPVYVIQVVSPINELLIYIDNTLLSHYPYLVYLGLSALVISCYYLICVLYGKACEFFINPLLRKMDAYIGCKYDIM